MGFAEGYVNRLQGLKFDDAFNPYTDICPKYDRGDAPMIRSETLRAMIASAQSQGVQDMWVGRDLGYKGGRRTGLAFTDDASLSLHCERWGIPVIRPTQGWVTEISASAIWEALDAIQANIFLWNVFPLHPHNESNPFSNRAHCPGERKAGKRLLSDLIATLRPQRLIAIGNDGYSAVSELRTSLEVHKVRHPSYGGKPEFLSRLRKLYS